MRVGFLKEIMNKLYMIEWNKIEKNYKMIEWNKIEKRNRTNLIWYWMKYYQKSSKQILNECFIRNLLPFGIRLTQNQKL
jgi:hypothetical protein